MAHAVSGPRREILKPYCEVKPVQNSLGLDVYLRSCRSLTQQAESYSKSGSLDNAYIYYKRFLNLALKEMPKHPTFRTQSYAQQRAWLFEEQARRLGDLERVVALMDEEEEARKAAAGGPCPPRAAAAAAAAALDIPEAPTSKPLEEEDSALDDLTRRLKALTGGGSTVETAAMPPMPPPSAPPAEEVIPAQPAEAAGRSTGGGGATAAMPMEDVFKILGQQQDDAWLREFGSRAGSLRDAASISRQPSSHTISQHTQQLIDGKRPLMLPDSLVAVFSEVAHPNTVTPPHGLETCGILAGKILEESLEVTHLIIPKQEATPNSCGMTHEDELFHYCFEHNLLTLGWIHTHPTQTCFMSSVDLHTHAPYQALLPEAVAVVVAPTDNAKRVGVFRLTEPAGLQTVMACTLTGFHQHPADVEIYQDVNIDWKNRPFETVDMRRRSR